MKKILFLLLTVSLSVEVLAQSAKIENIRYDFNAKVNGKHGMKIIADVTIYNCTGQAWLYAFLDDDMGNPMMDVNGKNAYANGQIVANKLLNLKYPNGNFYKDVTLSISYEEMHLYKGSHGYNWNLNVYANDKWLLTTRRDKSFSVTEEGKNCRPYPYTSAGSQQVAATQSPVQQSTKETPADNKPSGGKYPEPWRPQYGQMPDPSHSRIRIKPVNKKNQAYSLTFAKSVNGKPFVMLADERPLGLSSYTTLFTGGDSAFGKYNDSGLNFEFKGSGGTLVVPKGWSNITFIPDNGLTLLAGSYQIISEEEYQDIKAVKTKDRESFNRQNPEMLQYEYEMMQEANRSNRETEHGNLQGDYNTAESIARQYFELATVASTRRLEGGRWTGLYDHSSSTASANTQDMITQQGKMRSIRNKASGKGMKIQKSPYEDATVRR